MLMYDKWVYFINLNWRFMVQISLWRWNSMLSIFNFSYFPSSVIINKEAKIQLSKKKKWHILSGWMGQEGGIKYQQLWVISPFLNMALWVILELQINYPIFFLLQGNAFVSSSSSFTFSFAFPLFSNQRHTQNPIARGVMQKTRDVRH